MPALSISLNDSVYNNLVSYTKEVGLTKSKVAENALTFYFTHTITDLNDIELADKAYSDYKAGKIKAIPADEALRELGLQV